MPSGIFRKLDIADLDALWPLIASYPELHWTRNALAATLQAHYHTGFGLFDPTGAALALACFSTVLDEAELLLIATHKHHLQQGHAKTLLSHALKEFRQAGIVTIFLEVNANNNAARALYSKLGFVEYGLRLNYYQNGEDAILYRFAVQ